MEKLSEQIVSQIELESKSFLESIDSEYGTLSNEDRKNLGAFFTPPNLVVQMLETFSCSLDGFANEDILDPTCGSGNLLIASLILGSSKNPKYYEHVFGNELSKELLAICRQRFINYCTENIPKELEPSEGWTSFWNWHLHQGNALEKDCISRESFKKDYIFNEV